MKYLVLLSAVVLCACSKTLPPAPAVQPKPTLAGEEWCDKVYANILNLQYMGQRELFEGESHKGVLISIDQHNQETGAKQRFHASCLTSMTTEQAECSFQARSFAELRLCNTP